MAAKKTPAKKQRISKINLWLSHYINSENPVTFLNKTESSRAAGYKAKNDVNLCKIGCENYNKLSVKIEKWLDEVGLSDNYLKQKLLSLLEIKETKFQTMKGAVNKDSLPDGVRVMATTGQIKYNEDGEHFSDGDTLLAIETNAIEPQRRSLDMAFKLKGSYAAEKKELSGEVTVMSKSEVAKEIIQELETEPHGIAGNKNT